MSKASQRFKQRNNGLGTLKRISENLSEYFIVHYSCESFFDLPEGNTPRITSIAIKQLKNGLTNSFSIHKIAEIKQIYNNQIDENYNDLEKEMLNEYFEFVQSHSDKKWIHINMRNINYGFEAIKHRYRVLGGKPVEISDDRKIDLARLFTSIYGKNYVEHPKFESLYKLNKITLIGFLSGKEEAKAFEKGNYVALHQSTLRKVDCMSDVLSLAIENDLKTRSNVIKKYGFTPSGIFYAAKESWVIAIILFLIATVVASLIAIGIGNLL